MTTPQNSAEVVEALTPTLDRFVLASTPMLRDCAEAVYEQLLYSVQDYLKANAEWNIELRATIHQLGENAAKAAGEYAEEVGRLRESLEDILASAGVSDDPDILMIDARSYEDARKLLDRAALTEPTDG